MSITKHKIVYGLFQMVGRPMPTRTTALEIMQQMARSSELFRETVRDVLASQSEAMLTSYDDILNLKVMTDWRALGQRKEAQSTAGAPLSPLSGLQGSRPSYDAHAHSVLREQVLNV